MHGGGDFGGSLGGHDFGGGHPAGGHHDDGGQHPGDGNRDGQVIPLFGNETSQSGRRLLSRARGARGLIGDAIIILVAVLVVVGIATLIFH